MASETLQFELITPAGVVMKREVRSVMLPTEAGIIQVLPEHRELVSIGEPGELVVESPEKEKEALVIAGGVVEVIDGVLRILADTAIPVTDIDLAEAEKKAAELAKQLEEKEKLDITSYEALQKQLIMEKAKLALAKKWRG